MMSALVPPGPSLFHCRDCGISFDSEASMTVHLNYHKENLIALWGRKEGFELQSSSQETSSGTTPPQGLGMASPSPPGKSSAFPGSASGPASANVPEYPAAPRRYESYPPAPPPMYAYRISHFPTSAEPPPPFYPPPPQEFYPPAYPKYTQSPIPGDPNNSAAILDLDTNRLHVYNDRKDENVPPPLPSFRSRGGSTATSPLTADRPVPTSPAWACNPAPGAQAPSPWPYSLGEGQLRVKGETPAATWPPGQPVRAAPGPIEPWARSNWPSENANAPDLSSNSEDAPMDHLSREEMKKKRPFSCDVCTKRFIRKGHLNRHLSTTSHKNKVAAIQQQETANQSCAPPSKRGRVSTGAGAGAGGEDVPKWTTAGDKSEVRSAFECFYQSASNHPDATQQLLPSCSFRPPTPPSTSSSLLTTVHPGQHPPSFFQSHPSPFLASQRNGFYFPPTSSAYATGFPPPPPMSSTPPFPAHNPTPMASTPPFQNQNPIPMSSTPPFQSQNPISTSSPYPTPPISAEGVSVSPQESLSPSGSEDARVVSAVRPYPCSACPKKFNHKTDLRRHLCLHTGIKPYWCSDCGKRFIRKDHLLKHGEIHKMKPPPFPTKGQASV